MKIVDLEKNQIFIGKYNSKWKMLTLSSAGSENILVMVVEYNRNPFSCDKSSNVRGKVAFVTLDFIKEMCGFKIVPTK